jgi:hypothetical protein
LTIERRKQLAVKLFEADPTASTEKVAKAAKLSPKTAEKVRPRSTSGESRRDSRDRKVGAKPKRPKTFTEKVWDEAHFHNTAFDRDAEAAAFDQNQETGARGADALVAGLKDESGWKPNGDGTDTKQVAPGVFVERIPPVDASGWTPEDDAAHQKDLDERARGTLRDLVRHIRAHVEERYEQRQRVWLCEQLRQAIDALAAEVAANPAPDPDMSGKAEQPSADTRR